MNMLEGNQTSCARVLEYWEILATKRGNRVQSMMH